MQSAKVICEQFDSSLNALDRVSAAARLARLDVNIAFRAWERGQGAGPTWEQLDKASALNRSEKTLQDDLLAFLKMAFP